jgi:hypothetical protein
MLVILAIATLLKEVMLLPSGGWDVVSFRIGKPVFQKVKLVVSSLEKVRTGRPREKFRIFFPAFNSL